MPIVLRRLTRPFTYCEREMAAGESIGLATTVLHTRADYWEHPTQFYPQRFIDHTHGPFQYAPYGGGARRCVGAAFADYEMKITLATILSRIEFGASASIAPRRVLRSITMGPKTPIELRVISVQR